MADLNPSTIVVPPNSTQPGASPTRTFSDGNAHYSGTMPVGIDGVPLGNHLKPASDLEGGGRIAVSTSAVEMTFAGTPRSIILTADPQNTGTLYVGKANVGSDGSNAVTFLRPGESVTLQYNDATNALYVVASAVGQYVWKGAAL